MNFILSIILAMAVNGSMVDYTEFPTWEVQCVEPATLGNTPVVQLCLQNPNPEHPVQKVVALVIETPQGIALLAYGYMYNDVVYWFKYKDGKFEQIIPISCRRSDELIRKTGGRGKVPQRN